MTGRWIGEGRKNPSSKTTNRRHKREGWEGEDQALSTGEKVRKREPEYRNENQKESVFKQVREQKSFVCSTRTQKKGCRGNKEFFDKEGC